MEHRENPPWCRRHLAPARRGERPRRRRYPPLLIVGRLVASRLARQSPRRRSAVHCAPSVGHGRHRWTSGRRLGGPPGRAPSPRSGETAPRVGKRAERIHMRQGEWGRHTSGASIRCTSSAEHSPCGGDLRPTSLASWCPARSHAASAFGHLSPPNTPGGTSRANPVGQHHLVCMHHESLLHAPCIARARPPPVHAALPRTL